MTREEAKHIVDVAFSVPWAVRRAGEDRTYQENEIREAKNTAIKALEQEPKLLQALEQEKGAYNALVANVHCEDAVNRSDMLDAIGHGTTYTSEDLQRIIKALPPVNPQPKTGHWKLVQRGKNIDICCSNCEAVRIESFAYNYTTDQLDKKDLKECFECTEMRYCPHCGAEMVEPQESEE